MASSCQLSTVNKDCIEQSERKRQAVLVSDVEGDQKESETLPTASTSSPTTMGAGDKQLKRIMANRLSAKESRERRKKLLRDLEGSIEILTKENSSLEAENRELRQQLAVLLSQARVNLGFVRQARQIESARQMLSADLSRARSLLRPKLLESLSKQQFFIDPIRCCDKPFAAPFT